MGDWVDADGVVKTDFGPALPEAWTSQNRIPSPEPKSVWSVREEEAHRQKLVRDRAIELLRLKTQAELSALETADGG